VRVGGAYLLTAKSWFNRVFTFAHELAHSIDPCDMNSVKIHVPGYDALMKCFQKQGFFRIAKDTVLCGNNDQRAEAFADWVAVQVTAEALEQYKPKFKSPLDPLNSAINSVRDLCHQESWLDDDTSFHPDPRSRIERIFGWNPAIREFLGCKPGEDPVPYCSLEGGQP
jgi:hypothetical protein